ncbi:hypothetical protein [Actinomadura sp. 9N407]
MKVKPDWRVRGRSFVALVAAGLPPYGLRGVDGLLTYRSGLENVVNGA